MRYTRVILITSAGDILTSVYGRLTSLEAKHAARMFAKRHHLQDDVTPYNMRVIVAGTWRFVIINLEH